MEFDWIFNAQVNGGKRHHLCKRKNQFVWLNLWLSKNKLSRLLTLQLIISVTRALALCPALDLTSTYTFLTPEQDLSSFSSRTFNHEQNERVGKKMERKSGVDPNLNECSLRYLSHKTCCSSDKHILACVVFWDGRHDVSRPVQ